MAICILYKPSQKTRPRYYRVEIAMNLFEEVSVMREWGISGGNGQTKIHIFGNLREASNAADLYRLRAQKRGYLRD
ncbi:WGR domain-containing protein [Shimia sp.]|uniref:WGR domain-containing protein n=1 Tax=Shimia sp. TaxID=1954381 RepID=UPI0032986809